MPPEDLPLSQRIRRSVTGHLRVALIALAFGTAAYGLIHLFIGLVRTVENM